MKQVEEFVHLHFLSLNKGYQQLNSKILLNKDFKGSSGFNIKNYKVGAVFNNEVIIMAISVSNKCSWVHQYTVDPL